MVKEPAEMVCKGTTLVTTWCKACKSAHGSAIKRERRAAAATPEQVIVWRPVWRVLGLPEVRT